jgi:signal transduction histidine kinase/ActR/RegA family two-component response regulator
MRISLRRRFSLGLCALVVGLMTAVTLIGDLSITRAIEGKIRKDLMAARTVFEQFQHLRFQQLLASARMVSEVPQIRAVVTTSGLDHATLLDSARGAQQLIQSDLLMLVDERGRLLASTTEPQLYGQDLAGDAALASALRGEPFLGMRRTATGRLYQVVAVPFVLGDSVVGSLLAGFVVDSSTVEILETMTNCRVALLHVDGVQTSRQDGLFEPLRRKLALLGGAGSGAISTERLQDERYLLLAAPPGAGPVSYVLARSLDQELSFYYTLRRWLLGVAAAILALALLLGTLYAGRITRPIQALVTEAQRVATGDLESRLVDSASDEIGDLARAFNRMTGELKRSRDELLQSEEQLRHAQKMEAVGRLAGSVAHDFSNLLTVILGNAQLILLQGPKDAARLQRTAEQVIRAAERAGALTRQLLAFSRKQVIQPRVLDLNVVLDDMDSMLQRLIGEDVEAGLVLDQELGAVKADPNQLEQVVMNLAINARDAMPHGGRLTIETANVTLDAAYAQRHVDVAPGRYVMLAVSDTGIGMDAAVLSRIFEPFFTTKEPGKGTGLGLSTVYGIVKQSGGHIQVHSVPGRGTTFKVYLPLADGAVEETRAAASSGELLSGSETILLVEDEPAVRALARDALEQSGYSVLEAQDGAEALVLGEQHDGRIHLMLADVVLPVLNGPKILQSLEPKHPEMRVLYMSGYADETIARHGVLSLGTAFLQKPFTTRSLLRKLREVLDAPAA